MQIIGNVLKWGAYRSRRVCHSAHCRKLSVELSPVDLWKTLVTAVILRVFNKYTTYALKRGRLCALLETRFTLPPNWNIIKLLLNKPIIHEKHGNNGVYLQLAYSILHYISYVSALSNPSISYSKKHCSSVRSWLPSDYYNHESVCDPLYPHNNCVTAYYNNKL